MDSADASLLLRRLSGLPINITGEISGVPPLSTPVPRTVRVVVDNNSALNSQGEYSVGVELSSVSGVAGMDVLLMVDAGVRLSRWELGDMVSNFQKDSEVGVGYIRIQINGDKELAGTGSGRMLKLYFKPSMAKADVNDVRIRLRDVKLSGQYGDDYNWYGNLVFEDGVIKINVSDAFSADLKEKFDEIDANKDGKISYAEASSKYPGLTQTTFNSYDKNKDGYIDKAEAGIVTPEEGEGSISEGEGLNEDALEGTTEGEGGGGDTKKCGCGGKAMRDNKWWRYVLDFVFVGMLLLAMSGMRRKGNR